MCSFTSSKSTELRLIARVSAFPIENEGVAWEAAQEAAQNHRQDLDFYISVFLRAAFLFYQTIAGGDLRKSYKGYVPPPTSSDFKPRTEHSFDP